MFGQLIPAGGGMPVPLTKATVLLGRSSDCDVVLPSRAISGRHCELNFKEGYWWVTDLDSHNGTGVNGVKHSHMRLMPNDFLCLPKTRFQITYDLPSRSAGTSREDFAVNILNEIESQTTASTVLQRPAAAGRSARVDPAPRPRPMQGRPAAAPAAAGGSAGAEPPMRKFRGKLVPNGGGPPIPLLDARILIGRSRDADIRLKFATVSGRHCLLTHEDGYWHVEDLSSSNGIRINGRRVDKRHLAPGDDLAVAGHRFTIDYTAEGEPPVDPELTSKSLLEKAGLQNVMNSTSAPAWIRSHENTANDQPRKYKLDDSDPD